MIDLHMHSTFSDGTLTPAALVAHGVTLGLSAMALTDHDNLDGLPEFMAACAATGGRVRGVPGVEISCEVPSGTMHMLGYFIDTAHAGLQAMLREVRGGRVGRNEQILARLGELGLPLTWAEVAAFAGEDVVGRPHFAQAMIQRGYVADKQEAFDRYLGKGKPAYLDRYRTTPEDSIGMIRAAGGVAVLAHPFTLDIQARRLGEWLAGLKGAGLGGIEVYYSEHSPAQVAEYAALAKAHGLVATGGSDFHGDANPQIGMGTGFGNLKVPDAVMAELDDCRARQGRAS